MMQWTIWDTLMVEMFFALLVLHAVPMDNILDSRPGRGFRAGATPQRDTHYKWNMLERD